MTSDPDAQVTGYWLLVTGYWLLVARHGSRPIPPHQSPRIHRHRGDEPHAERQQPEERDDDSEPGEQDGAAGGGDSAGGGLDRVEPEPGPQGAVLVDDRELCGSCGKLAWSLLWR